MPSPGTRRQLNRERTATIATGACGTQSVTVEPQDFGGGGGGGGSTGTGVGGTPGSVGGVPIRTNFDGLGAIGGGQGYSDTITQAQADTVVSSAQGLRNAVSSAQQGATIFVTSGAQSGSGSDTETASTQLLADGGGSTGGSAPGSALTLSITGAIPVNTNQITIASDRGVNGSPGAILQRKTVGTGGGSAQSPLFRVTADSVRITGFQLQGPRSDRFDPNSPENPPQSTGVRLEGGGCEVDNCEVFGWTTAGVTVADTFTAAIHHNRIHDCAMATRGWGVRLDQPARSSLGEGCSPATAENASSSGGGTASAQASMTTSTVQPLIADGGGTSGGTSWSGGGSGTTTTRSIITYNAFDADQNAVSATGDGASFTVKKSVVGPGMYGEGVTVEPPGGYQVNVDQCTFEAGGENEQENIHFRGIPGQGATVDRTWHTMGRAELAIRQSEDGEIIADAGRGGFDGVDVTEQNHFGESAPSDQAIGAQQFL